MDNLCFKRSLAVIALLGLTGFSFAQTQEDGNPGWFTVSMPPVAPGWRVSPDAPVSAAASPDNKTLKAVPLMAPLNAGSGAAPEIQDLAYALQNDPVKMFDFVYNHIAYVPYFGYLKGPVRTLLDRSGNDLDQAVLLNELLKASGNNSGKIMFGTMTMPLVDTNGYGAANWLGVDTNMTIVVQVLSAGGISVTNQGSDVVLERFWVEAEHDGTTVNLDPAFKRHLYYPGLARSNLYTAMNFNLTNFLYWAGGTFTTNQNYVHQLYDTGVRNQLETYTTNLLAFLKGQYPNTSVEEALGGKIIKIETADGWASHIGFNPVVSSNDINPYDFAHKLTVAMDDSYGYWDSRSYCFPDISTSILSIRSWQEGAWVEGGGGWTKWNWDFTLDGQSVFSRLVYTRNYISWPRTATLRLSVEHPYRSTNLNQTVTYPLTARFGTLDDFYDHFNVIIGFDSSAGEYLKTQQRKLEELRDSGETDGSDAVIHATLNLIGQEWLKETIMADDLVYKLAGARQTVHHRVGVVAQTDGYYIDVKAQMRSAQPKAEGGSWYYPFRVSALIGSAMEHGVLEQLQGTNRPAASTVKLLRQTGTSSATNKGLYAVTSSNDWAVVKPLLIDYTDGQKTALEEHLNAGLKLILPANAKEYVSSWNGLGYIAYNLESIKMLIDGKYGGFCGGKWTVQPSWVQNVFQPINRWSVSTFHPLSIEPVDMATGHYLHDHTDLKAGAEEPCGLELSRFYNSRHSREKRSLGYGWSHSYDNYVREISDYETGLGGRTLADAAPSIAAALVSLQLAPLIDTQDATQIARFWGISVLVNQWWMDQLTQNAAAVNWNSKGLTFIKQPGGTYSSPPGVTAGLAKTNGTYTLKERFGTDVTFGPESGTNNPDFKIRQWKDADSNTLTFTYSGEQLDKVTDCYGRYFQFNYYNSTGLLSSVVDQENRTVSYSYVGDCLSRCTDPERYSWSFTYDASRRMLSVTNPLSERTILNSYNSQGQVTNQIFATGNNWKFDFTGFENIEEDPTGAQTTYYFDDKQRQTGRRDAEGHLTQTVYDGQNHPVYEIDARGTATKNSYDANHNLTQKTESYGTPVQRDTYYFYDTQYRLTDQYRLWFVSGQTAYWQDTHWRYDAEHHPTNIVNGLGYVTAMTYHPNGLLHTKTDARTNTTTYAYDSYGNPLTIQYANGNTWNYDYSRLGDLLSVTDPLSHETIYTYDKRRVNLTVRDAAGQIASNAYDGLERLISSTDRNTNITVQVWNAADKLVKTVYPDGGTVSNTYDLRDELIAVTDARGNTNSYTLDKAKRIVAAEDTLGRVVSNTYDAVGNVLAVTDPIGNVTSNAYDLLNRLVTTVDHLGGVAQYAYDALDNMTADMDPLGRITQRAFDELGRMTIQRDALTNDTLYTYDPNGNLIRKTDARGKATVYGYDQLNRLTSTTDPLTNTASKAYDAAGNVFTVTDARGFTTTNEYNELNRRTLQKSPIGNQQFSYDLNGNVIQEIDARGNITTRQYDTMNRLIREASGNSWTVYTYDRNGNRLTKSDALGNVTSNQYDIRNRIVKTVDPENGAEQTEYDAAGRVSASIDAMGRRETYSYDALGRKTAVHRPDGYTEQYEYDAVGNRTAFINAKNSRWGFGYDALNRLTAETNAIGQSKHYVYDAVGNQIQRTDARGQATTYQYDALNRQTNVLHAGVWKAAFAYDANGNRTAFSNQVLGVRFAYDPMNHLVASTASVSSVSSVVKDSYDLNGNRTNIVYPGGKSVAYTYDEENRLKTVNLSSFGLSTFDFRYDAAGRMTNIVYPNGVAGSFAYDGNDDVVAYAYKKGSSNFIERAISRNANGYKIYENSTAGLEPAAVQAVSETRDHDAADRLVSNGNSAATNNTAYGYDPNGNLTNRQSAVANQQFSYDYDNRLTSVSGGSSSTSTVYLYDASGARVGRVSSSGVTNYSVLNYSADSDEPLCETDASGTITRYFIWTPLGLVAQIEADGTAHYIHSDELGNVIAFTDHAGAVVAEYFYGPYGDVWAQNGFMDSPFRFGGAYGVYTEPDVNLLHMQARYYSPEMKRFISADPAGLKGGVNFYTYADGNPLNNIDPEGLCARPSLFGRTSLFGSSSSRYAPPTTRPMGFGEQMYRAAATFTGARGFTTAIQGRDPLGDPFSRPLSTPQRWAAVGEGTLNFGMYMAGSAALGRSAGTALNRGGYALSAARSAVPYSSPAFRSLPAASRALTTSRITNPARMLPAPNPAQGYAARVPTVKTLNEAGVVRDFVTSRNQKFYRVYSGGATQGKFLTAIPPQNRAYAQEALSLPRANTAEFIQEVNVPAGIGLRRSRAAPISANEMFPNRRGGGEQFELMDFLDEDAFGPGRMFK